MSAQENPMPTPSHPRRAGLWRQLAQLLAAGLLLAGLLPAQAGQLVLDSYYHNDHLGSPAAATDERGDLLWRAHYRPYGERQEAPKSERFGNLGYTGHAQDADSQLVYAGARYYDPLIGRFLAVDPAPVASSAPGSFNRYSYTLNNPYRFNDPSGESPSPTDVYSFAVDVGNLLVQEAVYVAAISVNDQAVANLAIEGMVEARADAAISTLGLISPAPGVAPALKAAKVAKSVDTASDTARQALRNAKEANGIPKSAQPDRTIKPNTREGNQLGLDDRNVKLYEYTNSNGQKIHIRQDRAASYGQGGAGDQTPHFNAGPAGEKLKQHHYY